MTTLAPKSFFDRYQAHLTPLGPSIPRHIAAIGSSAISYHILGPRLERLIAGSHSPSADSASLGATLGYLCMSSAALVYLSQPLGALWKDHDEEHGSRKGHYATIALETVLYTGLALALGSNYHWNFWEALGSGLLVGVSQAPVLSEITRTWERHNKLASTAARIAVKGLINVNVSVMTGMATLKHEALFSLFKSVEVLLFNLTLWPILVGAVWCHRRHRCQTPH